MSASSMAVASEGKWSSRRRHGRRVMAILIRRLEHQIAGGDVNRTEAACETACLGARRIDMALVGPLRKLRHWVGTAACMLPKAQKHIVMAVENRLHSQIFLRYIKGIGMGHRHLASGLGRRSAMLLKRIAHFNEYPGISVDRL